MAFDRFPVLPVSEEFRDRFAQVGAAQPLIIWRPSRLDLRRAELRHFWDVCACVAHPAGMMSRADFDTLPLDRLREHLSIFKHCPATGGFTIVEHGSGLIGTRGQDLTGHTLAAVEDPVRTFLQEVLGAAQRTGYPVLTMHEPIEQVFARNRVSLVYPLTGTSGAVTHLAAVTISDNDLQPGLDAIPDPTLVVRADRTIAYANLAAVTLFGAPGGARNPITLDSYCGMSLDLPTGQSGGRTWLREYRDTTVCGGVIVHFHTTARQILFRDRPYTVIVLRPS